LEGDGEAVEGLVELRGRDSGGAADEAALAEDGGEAGQSRKVGVEDAGDEDPGTLAGLLELGGGADAAAEGKEVMKVAERGSGEGAEEAWKWEVFANHEEAVAFDVEGFEAGGAAGGVGVAMVDDGRGDVAAGPAGPAGAETKVRIFAVEEEGIVEAAGLGEHR